MKLNELCPRSVCVLTANPFSSVNVDDGGGVSTMFGGDVDPSEKGHEGAGGFANDSVVLDGAVGDCTLQQSHPPRPHHQNHHHCGLNVMDGLKVILLRMGKALEHHMHLVVCLPIQEV